MCLLVTGVWADSAESQQTKQKNVMLVKLKKCFNGKVDYLGNTDSAQFVFYSAGFF